MVRQGCFVYKILDRFVEIVNPKFAHSAQENAALRISGIVRRPAEDTPEICCCFLAWLGL